MLGLLNVQSRTTRQFTPEDEELLTAIGNQIGIAIANAQLIDDAEQRRATLDSVMNSLVDGLILVDRRGRIAYANPRAEEMLGLPWDTGGPDPRGTWNSGSPTGSPTWEQVRSQLRSCS